MRKILIFLTFSFYPSFLNATQFNEEIASLLKPRYATLEQFKGAIDKKVEEYTPHLNILRQERDSILTTATREWGLSSEQLITQVKEASAVTVYKDLPPILSGKFFTSLVRHYQLNILVEHKTRDKAVLDYLDNLTSAFFYKLMLGENYIALATDKTLDLRLSLIRNHIPPSFQAYLLYEETKTAFPQFHYLHMNRCYRCKNDEERNKLRQKWDHYSQTILLFNKGIQDMLEFEHDLVRQLYWSFKTKGNLNDFTPFAETWFGTEGHTETAGLTRLWQTLSLMIEIHTYLMMYYSREGPSSPVSASTEYELPFGLA